MLHTFTKFSFLLLFLLIGFSSYAVNYTWTGQVSTDWNTAGNWSPAGVPGALDVVTIPEGSIPTSPTQWPVLSSGITVLSMVMNKKSQLDVNGFPIVLKYGLTSKIGSIINNSNSQSDIIITITGSHYEGGESLKIHSIFNGNVKLILRSTDHEPRSDVYSLFSKDTRFNGNLEIDVVNVNVNELFDDVVIVGDFKYTNTGPISALIGKVTINGKLNVDVKGDNDGNFSFYNVVNNTTGGHVDIQDVSGVSVAGCTLKVSSLRIAGWRSKSNYIFYNGALTSNTIEGDLYIETSSQPGQTYPDYVPTKRVYDFNVSGATTIKHHSTDLLDIATGNYEGDMNIVSDGGGKILMGGRFTYLKIYKNLDLYGETELSGVSFGGSENSIVNQTGPWTILSTDMQFVKTGPGKISFLSPLLVKSHLDFTSGILESNSANPVVFQGQVAISGASDLSHIVGPVHKIGNSAFVFPIGTGLKYTPVSISAPSSVTDEFSAEYIASSPTSNGYNTSSKAGSITNVYNSGFWDVKRVAGSSNVSVSLGYNVPAGYITNQSKLRVAHWNGSIWEDLGNGGTSGSLTVGTVTTATGVTTFSPFTIASTDASNPLPVKLVKFSVQKENETALLQWSTTEEINSDRFEIEHSTDARKWEKLSEVSAAEESKSLFSYHFTHLTPFPGSNYYRLKMVDLDGSFAYSKIETLKLSSLTQTIVYPNPVADRLFINTANGMNTSKVEIINLVGRRVLLTEGSSLKSGINLSKLPVGIYFLNVSFSDGQIETHKIFVSR